MRYSVVGLRIIQSTITVKPLSISIPLSYTHRSTSINCPRLIPSSLTYSPPRIPFTHMKRTHQKMAEKTKQITPQTNTQVRKLPNSNQPRPVIPTALLTTITQLCQQAVNEAIKANELPQHDWTPFHISVMASHREATHYTSSILKNANAWIQKNQPTPPSKTVNEGEQEESETGDASSGKMKAKKAKKRKIKNEKGEWIAIREPSDEGDATTTADGTASSSSGSELKPDALAFTWARIIGQQLQRILTSTDPTVADLLTKVTIAIDVPEPNQSIRGGGFLDFCIHEVGTEKKDTDVDMTAAASSSSNAPASALSPSLSTATSFEFSSIGTIDSVFKLKYGTPRQGTIAPMSRGSLTLHSSIPVESLDGLQDYSHIWLVFIFHRNENKKFRPKIEPPRAGGRKLGVFATRTPHRINPIGLTLVKLDRIEGRTLFLSSLDLIQGTPIVDIKPYHPADSITDFRIPEWMRQQNEIKPPFQVHFTSDAQQQLHEIIQQKQMDFYQTYDDALDSIRESVSHDPRPIYVRQRASPEEVYGYRFDRLNILYRVHDAEQMAEVCAIQYVDYAALLKEQQQAEADAEEEEKQTTSNPDTSAAAASTSSSTTAAPSTRVVVHSSLDEEYITKKFLEQRPKQSYQPMSLPNNPTQSTLSTVSTSSPPLPTP